MPKTHAVGPPTLAGHVDAAAGAGFHPEWVPAPVVPEPEPAPVVAPALVGEHGPELRRLPKPGQIKPSPRRRSR